MAKLSLPQEMQKSSDQVKFFYELVGRLNNRIQGSQVFFIFFFHRKSGFHAQPWGVFQCDQCTSPVPHPPGTVVCMFV